MAEALCEGAVIARESRIRTLSPSLRWLPGLTTVLLLAPIAGGLLGTLLPAFGYFPTLGGTAFSLDPWRRLWDMPGIWISIRLSLVTGLVTTVASLAIIAAFCAAWHGTRLFVWTQRLLAPMLAIPHVAVAFGIAFLLAPSGWILRLLSPWATGYIQPPDFLIVQDPWGLTLALSLISKEVPYLLIVTLAALGQVDAERSRIVARTLGYQAMNGWLKAVFPRVYSQIRLPVFAVLAYGISVVDVAIILGPTTPATLAVRLVRMFNDSDLGQRFEASAGAVLQLGLVTVGLVLWFVGEAIVRRIGTDWISRGNRGTRMRGARFMAAAVPLLSTGAVFLSLAGMILWSFATSWRFPNFWPAGLTLANWSAHLADLRWPVFNTVALGVSTVLLAVGLAIGVLELEGKTGRESVVGATGLLYLPLIIPQVALLFGAQLFLIAGHLDGRWAALLWIHLIFVFPYVFLSLADAYRNWDARYERIAACLGAPPARVFLRIKFPMLLRPILISSAVGFAVSTGLYLPTLFAGSGRFPTLITESVALSAGGDNRLVGIYALWQMILPCLGFLVAMAWPAWRFRQRTGMQVLR